MAQSSESKPILAVDLGGTKIVTALITPQGEILSRRVARAKQGLPVVVVTRTQPK